MLSKTHRRCLDIRNRLYPRDQWPDVIYTRRLESRGGRDKILVEIGCGRDATALRNVADEFELAVGVDVEVTRQGAGADRWRTAIGDGHRLPLKTGSADVVGISNVVEHLADPAAVFRECARILEPGGCLVVLTVNKWFPPVMAARLLPHRIRQGLNRIASATEREDTFLAFYRANDISSLRAAGMAAGLRTTRQRFVTHHPRYFMFSVLAYRLAVVAEHLSRRFAFLTPLRHFLLCEFELPHLAGTDAQPATPGGVHA